MFLKHALARRARRLPGTVAAFILIAMAGCTAGPSGSTINDIIDAQLAASNKAVPGQTTRIVLINQTESTIELDLLIDNVLTTVSVTPTDQRTDYIPAKCPSSIETVQERRLDDQGRYLGGRNYNHNPAYTFTSGQFNCTSTFIFTFNEDSTDIEVL